MLTERERILEREEPSIMSTASEREQEKREVKSGEVGGIGHCKNKVQGYSFPLKFVGHSWC